MRDEAIVLMLVFIVGYVLGGYLMDFFKYQYDTREGTILCEGAKSIVVYKTKTYCLKENKK
jgi:hypothetical protein